MMRLAAIAHLCWPLLAVIALTGCQNQEPPPAPPRPVQVTTVHFESGTSIARYSGDVRARYEHPLAFQVGGKLIKRSVDVGAVVKRGQVLAVLDPIDARLSEAAAVAQLAAAQAELDQTQRDWRHLSHLAEMNLASPAALQRRRDQVNAAEARLRAAQAQRGESAQKSGYTELRASFDGVITGTDGQPGQVVATGQTMMRMARTDEKEVVISVPENRWHELRGAAAIRVNLWANPERFYAGRLREISPGVDEVLRTYTAKIALPDADALVALGMTATVHVETATPKPFARLPLTALTREADKPAVWVFDPGSQTVQPRAIELGNFDATAATVLAGVAEGETVVTAGVHKLIAGQRVRVLGDHP